VRVKKWREGAQPEWPESLSGVEIVSATGEAEGREDTRRFPDTGRNGALRAGLGDGASAKVPHGGPRDPWATSDGPAHTPDSHGGDCAGSDSQRHDPHEVTVQLDAVGPPQDPGRRRTAEGGPAAGGADGSDGPVFVDESGRRSRRFRRLGIVLGIACAVYAVVIVGTLLSGSSDAPWLPVPGQREDRPAGQVEPTSPPARSARPTGAVSVPPGSSPATGDGTGPMPDPSGTAPGASKGSATPGASKDPEPTATRSTSKPGGPGVVDPDPSPSTAPTTPASPDPSPGAGSVTPSESPVGDGTGPGTGTVADGPSSPSPIAEEPGAPGASSAPSPEHTL
jgi:hypothetical protein